MTGCPKYADTAGGIFLKFRPVENIQLICYQPIICAMVMSCYGLAQRLTVRQFGQKDNARRVLHPGQNIRQQQKADRQKAADLRHAL